MKELQRSYTRPKRLFWTLKKLRSSSTFTPKLLLYSYSKLESLEKLGMLGIG